MCAIAGILGGAAVNPQAIQSMIDRMAHRGPDGEGTWLDAGGTIGLGHRRLAIIDPTEDSRQPMLSADGTLALVFNGEIYNYRELRAELEAKGVRFRSEGDSEVLLAAYEAWGEACVERFNGMFAFALWDGRRRVLFCARDRFGEKPFLYAATGRFFAFASEYRALLGLKGVGAAVDEARLARFLITPADGLDRGEATLFPAIRQLPAAHMLVVEADSLRLTTRRYWAAEPAPDGAGLDMEQAAQRFGALLADSVALRLRSDVTVGSCLSGGLDSGSIAGLIRRQLGPGAPYHVFSGRFPGAPQDEGAYMDILAENAAATRHEVAPDGAGLMTELADFAWANELPVDSASQYAQYCVFRLARASGVTVLLDGQGADEVLGGYEQYFAAYLRDEPTEREAICRRYPGILDAMAPWHTRLPAPLRRLIARRTGRGSDIAFGIRSELIPAGLPQDEGLSLAQSLRRDSLDGFLATLLRYGDRNSMAHSIEVRLPFCDHRLFELAQGLAPRLLMGDAQTKRLLREAMRGILPEPVRTRWRKQGFLPPQEIWLHGTMLPAAEQAVRTAEAGGSPLWAPGWWAKALERFKAGAPGLGSPLWKLVATEAWREHFLARVAAMPRLPPLL